MKPIVSVSEMKEIDASADTPESELIHRAGWAVSRAAIRLMGGTYGRRVVVVAGPGNNGADGRVAAQFLEDRGVRTAVVAPGDDVPLCNLVIDAAFGTGFRGEYKAPDVGDALVLAVDIPSGVQGDTGVACEGAVRADHTVTFAAYKPGHFLADGPELCGDIELVDIGLDVSGTQKHLLEFADLSWVLPPVKRESHKWKSAVGVVAGSPGMMGAAHLCAIAAQRAGAGMVRLLSPGVSATDADAGVAVAIDGTNPNWADTICEVAPRLGAIVIGPGLGRSDQTQAQILEVLDKVDLPAVVDADALFACATDSGRRVLQGRTAATVLTPHEGEFSRLNKEAAGPMRHEDTFALARSLGVTILLKGSTTVVADSEGDMLFTTDGDARLATAGTGDVLAGIIGAFLAQGVEARLAAAAGACVHGVAAKNSYRRGLIASDIPKNVSKVLS